MDRKCKQVKEMCEKGFVGILCGPTWNSWQCSDPDLSDSGTLLFIAALMYCPNATVSKRLKKIKKLLIDELQFLSIPTLKKSPISAQSHTDIETKGLR